LGERETVNVLNRYGTGIIGMPSPDPQRAASIRHTRRSTLSILRVIHFETIFGQPAVRPGLACRLTTLDGVAQKKNRCHQQGAGKTKEKNNFQQEITEPTEEEKTLKPAFLRCLCDLLLKICLLSFLGAPPRRIFDLVFLAVKNAFWFLGSPHHSRAAIEPNPDLDELRHR
jgi:hypothetical protein